MTRPAPLFGLASLGGLRRYRRLIALVVACVLVQTAAALAGPLVVRHIVTLVEPGAAAAIGGLSLLLACVYAIRSAAAFAVNHYSHIVAFRTCHDLRRAAYAHVQRLPPAWFADRPSGEVVSRIVKDTDDIEPLLADAVYGFVAAAVVAVGVLFVLYWLDPVLATVALLPLPCALGFILWQGRRVQPAFEAEASQFAQVQAAVQDNVGGMVEIQGFARERGVLAALARRSRALARRQIANRTLIARFDPAVDGATGLSIALVIWAGGLRMASGAVGVEDLIAVLLYIAALYQPLYVLVGAAESAQEGLTALRRIDALLATEPEIADPPGAIDPRPVRGAIAFEGVSFAYGDRTPVLHDVSFAIRPGQTVALVGATGAGKSTLAALLSRFHDVSAGRITLDGRDLRDLALGPLRESVARVSQDVFLFNATVREVIAMGRPDATRTEIEEAARAAEAHGFIAALPQGYDTRVGERGVRLSGGQKQRLSIARAILKDAPVLILDEATSAIDAATEARLQATLDRLMAGRTALVIAHRLSTVRRADRILVLDAGRIVEAGDHATLLARGGTYAALARTQLGAVA